jgi:hypothetical protein
MTKESPFKFLDAYEKEDKDLFFGREQETQTLYDLTFNTRLILLYGGSGTGKTSLIQCGLANEFRDTRWYSFSIRRGDNLLDSTRIELQAALKTHQIPKADIPEDLIKQAELLYRHSFKPIYLIFDQFEELFVLGDEAEQQAFFQFIRRFLDKKFPGKIIISMREEFIADLWDFEKIVPSLFEYRFRVEKMRTEVVKQVIEKTLRKLEERGEIRVSELDRLTEGIMDRLKVDGKQVELTYLQVFLDRLYRVAAQDNGTGPVHIRPAILDKIGAIKDVIGDFLDDQVDLLEEEIGQKGVAMKILGELVSDKKTKKRVAVEALEEIRERLDLQPEQLQRCLDAFEQMRIIKRYN